MAGWTENIRRVSTEAAIGEELPSVTSDQQTETISTTTASAGKTKRHARTVYVDDGLWERVRAAVGHMRYFDIPNEPDTLVDLVQSALEVRVAGNGSLVWPHRDGLIRPQRVCGSQL